MIIKTSDQSKASSGATALYVNRPASIRHVYSITASGQASDIVVRTKCRGGGQSTDVGRLFLKLFSLFEDVLLHKVSSYFVWQLLPA